MFRTNCVDCLDRTNVVQGLLARHALEDLLQELGVLAPGEELATLLPKVGDLLCSFCQMTLILNPCEVKGCRHGGGGTAAK